MQAIRAVYDILQKAYYHSINRRYDKCSYQFGNVRKVDFKEKRHKRNRHFNILQYNGNRCKHGSNCNFGNVVFVSGNALICHRKNLQIIFFCCQQRKPPCIKTGAYLITQRCIEISSFIRTLTVGIGITPIQQINSLVGFNHR